MDTITASPMRASRCAWHVGLRYLYKEHSEYSRLDYQNTGKSVEPENVELLADGMAYIASCFYFTYDIRHLPFSAVV